MSGVRDWFMQEAEGPAIGPPTKKESEHQDSARQRQIIGDRKELGVEECMANLRIAIPRDESEMTPEEIEKIKNTRVGFIHDNEDPRRTNHLFDAIPYYTNDVLKRMRQIRLVKTLRIKALMMSIFIVSGDT